MSQLYIYDRRIVPQRRGGCPLQSFLQQCCPRKSGRREYHVDNRICGQIFVQACQILSIYKGVKAIELCKIPTFGYTITFLPNQVIKLKEESNFQKPLQPTSNYYDNDIEERHRRFRLGG